MLALEFKADLAGVSEFGFVDSPEQPFFFTFKVECGACHELHPNPVGFSMHELKPLANSRGSANFAMKCKFCGKDSNLTVEPLKTGVYTGGKAQRMASFDCRGLALVEFVPDGDFWAVGEDSGTRFSLTFEDGEWYDYDEKAGQEVSITGAEWTISKTK